MFTIEMLPAEDGDCLWIKYGDERNPRQILIDGGRQSSSAYLLDRIKALPEGERHFELFIVTHIDADHIDGSLELLRELESLKVSFDDVWFNAWKHIAPGVLGPLSGEYFSDDMEHSELPWNLAFEEKAIVVPDDGEIPVKELPGGMKLTLLSPTKARLVRLRAEWQEVIESKGLEPGEVEDPEREKRLPRDILGAPDVEDLCKVSFKSDGSVPNGSSIAVLAEYKGKSCLLTGDAYATILVDSLDRLLAERGANKLDVDAFKLPHHGSRGNISVDLLERMNCPRYLFSTNGSRHKHPDKEAVARVIKYGGRGHTLYFNYKTKYNDFWDDQQLMQDYDCQIEFCKDNEDGRLLIEL
jgi:hypothetical protein